MNDIAEAFGPYEPDESYMQSLFARPARPAQQRDEVFVAGVSFGGCTPEEADAIRWADRETRMERP